MNELEAWQYILIGLLFVWSGFVRSGLGFGGAVLSLPFLLLVHNDPLIFLPIIAVHLLVFSAFIAVTNHRRNGKQASLSKVESNIDWRYLKRSLKIMIVPKLVGVFGLLTLPTELMGSIIFTIVMVYAFGYALNKPFTSNSTTLDASFLMLGGYISGTSLIGAPLIVAVYASHVAKHQLRDTLFALWFILVLIKCIAFIWAGIDFQLIHHLWLLPCATFGHIIGMRFHEKIIHAETPLFFRLLGITLILVSVIGLWNAWN
ncbi:sulfite exporter TauE/SafE family protein [Neptunomonas sp.]|uniref:sulfite exporter TauE/SafE family protein n=1 Tax=Neptunomonas sp. TaxID=1971898 RepID=UPI0025D023C9|nr:sulfite exporter TauE/SafE family protein [Neptunomonas sp.]